jgi:hypothetical protein
LINLFFSSLVSPLLENHQFIFAIFVYLSGLAGVINDINPKCKTVRIVCNGYFENISKSDITLPKVEGYQK